MQAFILRLSFRTFDQRSNNLRPRESRLLTTCPLVIEGHQRDSTCAAVILDQVWFLPPSFSFKSSNPVLQLVFKGWNSATETDMQILFLSLIYADIFVCFFSKSSNVHMLEILPAWIHICPGPKYIPLFKRQIERELVNFQTMIVAPLSVGCTICKYGQITLRPCFNFTLEQEYLSGWCGTLCWNFCNFTLKGFFKFFFFFLQRPAVTLLLHCGHCLLESWVLFKRTCPCFWEAFLTHLDF